MYVYDASTVDHNVITMTGEDLALIILGNGSNITGNTITLGEGNTGISTFNADSTASITWNRITGNGYQAAKGIAVSSPNVSIRSNSLGNLAYGIMAPCSDKQVSANIIFDTTVGISGGPADAPLSNTFLNVPTPQVACS
jgi:hypothetical protein